MRKGEKGKTVVSSLSSNCAEGEEKIQVPVYQKRRERRRARAGRQEECRYIVRRPRPQVEPSPRPRKLPPMRASAVIPCVGPPPPPPTWETAGRDPCGGLSVGPGRLGANQAPGRAGAYFQPASVPSFPAPAAAERRVCALVLCAGDVVARHEGGASGAVHVSEPCCGPRRAGASCEGQASATYQPPARLPCSTLDPALTAP